MASLTTHLSVTKAQVMTLRCGKSLRQFVEQAWPTIEPQVFTPGWHLDAVCEHLQAVSTGQIRDLIINIPPRHTKSLVASVMWPAWEWGPFGCPKTRWMFTSYAGSLSVRDSVKCRRVIQSPWYQGRWGHVYQLTGDQNAKERYDNDRSGYRLATSVDGAATGEGGDRIVVDDPHSLTDVHSDTIRQRAIDWWDQVMSTRVSDPKTGSRVIIMQRGHHDDLAGHIFATNPGKYEMLVLPAEFEVSRRCVTSLGFRDPRREEGELLWPARFNVKDLGELKTQLGSYAASAQLQQRPSKLEGNIVKRHWWKYYTLQELSELVFDFVFQSWDMTFKGTQKADYVAGQVWGMIGANYYLLDRLKERMSFTETLSAFRRTGLKWPMATAKYVEAKANGEAVIDSLRQEISGIIPVNPHGTKESRLFAVSPIVEAGNIYLPVRTEAPWVDEFVEELCTFPTSPNDDEVDAFSQAINETRVRTKILRIPPVVSMTKSSAFKRVNGGF